MPVSTPVSGWYPVRLGYGNSGGGSNFEFTHSDSGAAPIAWTRERVRARAGEMSGTLRTVFGQQILGGGQGPTPPVVHFEEGNLLPVNTFATALQGAGPDNWSATYFGQVYVTQPGAYTLRITSDDGSRARLGTGHGESHWGRNDGTGCANATASADLIAGWNDLSVDYNQVAGAKSLRVQIGGPDFAGMVEVPRDRLRPVESADDRFAFATDDTSAPVPDGGNAASPGTATMPIVGYANEMVSSVDITYEVDSPHWDQLKADLETPTGTRVTIRDQITGLPNGNQFAQVTISPGATGALGTLLGVSANGAWKLHVYDVMGGGGGSTLQSAKLTLHTTGGPDKVARTASWTSPVLDAQTHVIAIDGVTWDERLPAGGGVEVRVGTCQQADCSDVTWSGPVAKATAFAVAAPARYLQLRVDMTSNGTLEPELRSLAVMYRRDPG